jgi:hypothetical protein
MEREGNGLVLVGIELRYRHIWREACSPKKPTFDQVEERNEVRRGKIVMLEGRREGGPSDGCLYIVHVYERNGVWLERGTKRGEERVGSDGLWWVSVR